MHRHLIAVEVGVEGGAHQRMQLNRLALDKHRLEGLNAEAVQGGGPVQHHRMLADDLGEDVPDLGGLLLHHLLGGLDGGGQPAPLQFAEDEGLEQFQRHLLRQAALMQFQGGAHHDHRAARIVHPLAQQVLAEAALLAFDHVRQRLQRPLVGAGDGAASAAVVQQGVHRLLQHTFFVAHDDVRGVEIQQALEPVVAVDDPAIQVVQIRGGEAPPLQRHQRTQFRRQHRQDVHHHPFRLVAGLLEGLKQFQALG